MAEYRLDKYLASIPVGSRSQVKEMIKKGRVCVNGITAKKPEQKIRDGQDTVTVDGKQVCYEAFVYYMLYKPAGVISATEDPKKETVLSLIRDKRKDLFPVGRLDIDTEGLLLITNDGELCHQLLSPKHHVDKCYYARTDRPIPSDAPEQFEKGLDLGDFTAMPAKLQITAENEALVTVQEGKFHQVKRMFEAVGKEVTYLKRMSMGSLKLDEGLALGEYRKLTEEELAALRGEI